MSTCHRRPPALLLLLLTALPALSCGEAGVAERKLNVLLISLDTTRADRLGAYGYGGGATPNIDALADAGVVFEQCASVAPMTVPAHASLMTGTYPFSHGVRDNGRYVLSPKSRTLAEALSASGWATGAQVGVFVLNRGTGLEQGFATYRDTSDAMSDTVSVAESSPPVPISRREINELAADVVADGASAWLRDHAEKPFFLFTHFFDPHAPYEPPEPFRSQQAIPGRTPELNRYLGEIAWVDSQVGRLLDELRELGLEDETLVVLTADHGEAFGEHREIGHSYFIYDTTIHVPLIVRLPGRFEAGRRVASQVRLIDVAPTILDLVGALPLPEAQGVSLAPYLRGETRDLGLVAYSETLAPFLDYRYSSLAALRTEEWKYIDAPRQELYQLASDPGELSNAIDDHPEVALRMRQRLHQLLASPAAGEDAPEEIDADRRARLQSLGYLGGAETALGSSRAGAEGADPKDRIEEMTQASTALRAFHDRDYARADRLYAELVERDPANTFFLSKLAETRLAAGRREDAAALYRVILEDDTESVGARRGLVRIALAQGDLAAATRRLSELLRVAPDDLRTWLDYGSVAAMRGDLDTAGDAFERALEIAPDNTEALVLSARVHLLARRYEAAVAALEHAITDPAAPDEARLQLAWLRATSPESALRDGARALELARWEPATSVVAKLVLAAALAESGDFAAAADEALAAAALPPTGPRDAHWTQRAPALAAAFQQGRPYRTREPL